MESASLELESFSCSIARTQAPPIIQPENHSLALGSFVYQMNDPPNYSSLFYLCPRSGMTYPSFDDDIGGPPLQSG